MISAAIYLRASTDEQVSSPEIQRQKLFDWAKLKDFTIIQEYIDFGVSGKIPLADRPAGKELLSDAHQKKFSVLLVYDISRFGRSALQILQAVDALKSLGISLLSLNESFDGTTPAGEMSLTMLAAIAQFERSQIQQRTSQGRDYAGRQGKWLGGSIPYGFVVDDKGRLTESKILVPVLNITEADLIREIFKRIAQGETLNSICAELNTKQILSTSRYKAPQSNDKFIKWIPSRLSNLLHNSVYIGQHVLKTKSGPIIRSVPAIINAQTYYKCHEQLIKNRTMQPGHKFNYIHLLRGLIRCGLCQNTYVAQALKSPRKSGRVFAGYYYVCSSKFISSKQHKPKCQGAFVKAADIEDYVWDVCKTILLDPNEMLARAEDEFRQNNDNDMYVDYQNQLAKVHEARNTYMKLINTGAVTYEQAESHLMNLNKQEFSIKAELENLRMQDELKNTYRAEITRLKSLLKTAKKALNEINSLPQYESRQAKAHLIKLLVRGIIVETLPGNNQNRARREHRIKLDLKLGKHIDFREFMRD